MVSPSVIAGAAVEVEFVFDLPEQTRPGTDGEDETEIGRKQIIAFKELATSLKGEIDQTKELLIANNRFVANEVNVMVGVTAEGEVGVAEVEAEFYGTLTYERQEELNLSPVSVAPASTATALIPVFKRYDGQTQDEFARNSGSMIRGGLDSSMKTYILAPGRLSFGLKRAYQLANLITKPAEKLFSNYWELESVEPGFSISVGGETAFATLQASAGLSINFSKQ